MTIWTVDVDFSTHDALKDGFTALDFRRVRVLAADAVEAGLIACQIVAAHGLVPTATNHCV